LVNIPHCILIFDRIILINANRWNGRGQARAKNGQAFL